MVKFVLKGKMWQVMLVLQKLAREQGDVSIKDVCILDTQEG